MKASRRAPRWLAVLVRFALATVAVILLVVAGAGYALYDPSPLGHFRSPGGRRAYAASYAAAMERLPPPSRTMDVATGFGTVRVYEFASTPGATPAVLLPGRSSGAPM